LIRAFTAQSCTDPSISAKVNVSINEQTKSELTPSGHFRSLPDSRHHLPLFS
jgi:hypothetical protein